MARKAKAADGQVIRYTTLKVRLDPTPAQAELFEKTFRRPKFKRKKDDRDSFLYECPVKAPEPVVPVPETTLGLKYSMGHFYVADNGETADPPKWLKQSREKLAELQRKLARMEPGPKNYEEAVQKYRLLHEHIANQRRDFIHKESRRIANGWDAVCVRNDALREMFRDPLRSGAAGSGYRMFRELLGYKLERQGKQLIVLDRYTPTARTCSACGMTRDGAEHTAAVWTCPRCGTVHNREVNAAKNIKLEGLAQFCA